MVWKKYVFVFGGYLILGGRSDFTSFLHTIFRQERQGRGYVSIKILFENRGGRKEGKKERKKERTKNNQMDGAKATQQKNVQRRSNR